MATGLLVLAFFDELWSGVAVVGAPGVEAAHGISHGAYTFLVFAVPLLLAALLETPVLLYSDRAPRHVVIASALALLSGSLVLCATASQAWVLSLGLTLAGSASGVATSAAEAELVSRHDPDRAMSRWMAFGAAGDIVSPLAVSVAIALGASYRAALVAIACAAALQAIVAFRSGTTGKASEDDDDSAPRTSLREALAVVREHPRLLAWLSAAAACTFLDELVLAFAALRFEGELSWSSSFVAASLSATSVGSFTGAVLTEKLVARWTARPLLIGACCLSATALAVVCLTTSPGVAIIALFFVGLGASPHWPLTTAAAYECVPGRPGLVAALSQPFTVVHVVVPIALGAIATRAGVSAALACLLLQPMVVLGVALWVRRR